MSITIKPLATSKLASNSKELSFGTVFSNHMFSQVYAEGRGWHDAQINPYHDIGLDPAASVLHYGQEIFEGLKAYRRADGGINLFRPEANIDVSTAPAPSLSISMMNLQVSNTGSVKIDLVGHTH